MLAYVKSDIGLVRENNEDNYIFVPPHLFAVADGMGGHVAGEVASNLVTTKVHEFMEKHMGDSSPDILLEQSIHHANQIIYQLSLNQTQYCGMGTTITVVYVDDDVIYWAHVGDSRIYLLHNNEMTQLTNDHSLVWELVKNGSISPEAATVHPQRNILTRAVGTADNLIVDTGKTAWSQQDMLLLCSDGLTNMVDEHTIQKLLTTDDANSEIIVDSLIGHAKAAGGIDNITAILLYYGE